MLTGRNNLWAPVKFRADPRPMKLSQAEIKAIQADDRTPEEIKDDYNISAATVRRYKALVKRKGKK